MSQYDDPNREAVGLAPIWTGAGDTEPPPEGGTQPASGSFDPGEHTVAEVEQYLAEHPDEAEAILDAEQAGKNRTSLTGG